LPEPPRSAPRPARKHRRLNQVLRPPRLAVPVPQGRRRVQRAGLPHHPPARPPDPPRAAGPPGTSSSTGHEGTWQTTDSGGSGPGPAVPVILAAAPPGPAAAAAIGLRHVLVSDAPAETGDWVRLIERCPGALAAFPGSDGGRGAQTGLTGLTCVWGFAAAAGALTAKASTGARTFTA
jgi:hypothetical protein